MVKAGVVGTTIYGVIEYNTFGQTIFWGVGTTKQ